MTDHTPEFVRPFGCICPMFKDTGGVRIADLCCSVHGVGGTDPGDGYWERIRPLPCCNEVEQDDGTAPLCDGTMQPGWPVYVCDKCGAACGAQVHPQHKRDGGDR